MSDSILEHIESFHQELMDHYQGCECFNINSMDDYDNKALGDHAVWCRAYIILRLEGIIRAEKTKNDTQK